jgi:hypothetical protein
MGMFSQSPTLAQVKVPIRRLTNHPFLEIDQPTTFMRDSHRWYLPGNAI